MKKKPVPNRSPEEARCRRLLGEALGFLLPGTENIFEFSGKSLDRWKYMFYNRMRGNFYLV